MAGVAAACSHDPVDPAPRSERQTVPDLKTALVTEQTVRDVISAFAAVAAAGESPELSEARTQCAEAEARLRLASQQVSRLESLSQGAVAPRRELEAARAEEAGATAAVARARQALAAFGTQAQRAPLAADETWVMAYVVQPDLAQVAEGAVAHFIADAFAQRTFGGQVDAAPAYVDPVSRTAPARLRVRDPERLLRPGMTGAVAIETGAPRPALCVPTSAVVYDGPTPVVFVEEAAGRFKPYAVRVGPEHDGRVEILSGVGAGVRVATTGAASLLSETRLPGVANAE